ncbi:MAG: hypothetical protein AAFP86_22255, partial [Planctomycetota bacterium]
VERVGDEVWIAAGRWVYRYDIPTRAFLGSFDTGAIVRGLEAWRGRVFVARDDAIGVRSGSGVPLGELPIVGAHDVLHLEDGSMLVAHRAAFRVVRYAADGSFVGNFAGPTIPTPFGIFSHPEQLSPGRAPNGEATVLVSGDVRVYEFTVEGTFLREIDVGPFEAGVSETLSGSILVSLGTGLALHDPETAFTSSVGGAFFGSGRKIGFFDRGLGAVPDEHDGRIGARAVCRGASTNDASAGRIAVLGSADPEDGALFVQVSGLPPGTPAIAAVARSASLPATLVAGARCLDSGSTVVLDEIAVAGASGAAFLSLRPANSTEASTVLAGATYFVQVASAQATFTVVGPGRAADVSPDGA